MREFIVSHGRYVTWALCCAGLCLTSNASAVDVQIRAAPDHAVLLKPDGTVWQWGVLTFWLSSTWNSCNFNLATASNSAVQIVDLTQITAIAAVEQTTIALKSDGTVWGWGKDPTIPTGIPCPVPNGTTTDAVWPVKDSNDPTGVLTGVAAIWGSHDSFFARKTDGSVWAWGINNREKLGVGSSGAYSVRQPMRVQRLPNAFPIHITSGTTHSVALLADRTLLTWGSNSCGQRGNTNTSQSNTQESSVGALSNVSSVVAGNCNTAATLANGAVYVWGKNQGGELGEGVPFSSDGETTPKLVAWPPGPKAAAVAFGEWHSVFRLFDGTALAMGYNGSGALGSPLNNPDRTLVPIPVPGIDGVTAVDAAGLYNVALRSDGTVWQWGRLVNAGMFILPTQVSLAGPVATTGICGAANGQSFDTAPIEDLCLIGTASTAFGLGPWTWQCTLNGSSSNCRANRGVSILVEPVDARAVKGKSASFSVLAQGSSTLQYQWYKASSSGDVKLVDRRGLNSGAYCTAGIAGATTPTLTLSGLCGKDGGGFYVVVTNPNGGSQSSRTAQLDYLVSSAPSTPRTVPL